MRYFITFSYDGTRFHGWQIQPNGISVQQVLEEALTKILRAGPISVVGAGRTDAGVHARQMVAHFDWPDEADPIDGPQLAYRLNRLLPRDVSVSKVEQVSPDLHARFSATRRTYHYYIHTAKDPFLRHYSLELHYPLDFELMNQAAALLFGYDDFGSFCKSHSDAKTTLCKIYAARWHQLSPTSWYFEISANRFLRNMVRAVVGTLIEVGRGRITEEQFCEIIERKDRCAAGTSMPGHALFLWDIKYPYEI